MDNDETSRAMADNDDTSKAMHSDGDKEMPGEGTDEPLKGTGNDKTNAPPESAQAPPQSTTADPETTQAPPAPPQPSQAPSSTAAAQPHASRRQFFITAVALQLVLLVAISIPSVLTLNTGRVITFDTTPVDPWDPFRGDYVTLGYTFSSVPTDEQYKPGERAFVVLKKTNETWDATRIQKTKPTSLEPDEVALKAMVSSNYEKKATVTYGIERVYIPERTGTDIKSGDSVQVDVALGDNGLAVIKEVRAKGAPIYKWRFL